MRLSPATSVIEYIMAMSAAPTYGATLPEATVDTITLGTPTGSACIAGVIKRCPAGAADADDPGDVGT